MEASWAKIVELYNRSEQLNHLSEQLIVDRSDRKGLGGRIAFEKRIEILMQYATLFSQFSSVVNSRKKKIFLPSDACGVTCEHGLATTKKHRIPVSNPFRDSVVCTTLYIVRHFPLFMSVRGLFRAFLLGNYATKILAPAPEPRCIHKVVVGGFVFQGALQVARS